MSKSNYLILCCAVLPRSGKVIAEDSVDLYEDEYHNLQETKEEILGKGSEYNKILDALKLTEKEIELEKIIIYVTVVNRTFSNHVQFTIV